MDPAEAARWLADVLTRDMSQSIAHVAGGNPGGCCGQAGGRCSDPDSRRHNSTSAARQVGPTPQRVQARRGFDSALAELLQRLPARDANPLAAIVAGLMWSVGDIGWEPGPVLSQRRLANIRLRTVLSRVLTDTSREQRDLRAVRMAIQSTGTGPGTLAAAVSLAAEPWPSRLSSQELVNLLKMPTCIGMARRVVLDQLGNVHGRRFANHWEFVRFAQEIHISLDFTTPPRRPDSLTLGFEEAPLR